MKYIIAIFCIFFGLNASSQNVNQSLGAPNTIVTTKGNHYVDSVFRLPKRQVSDTRLKDTGSIYYRISDSALRAWTGFQYLTFYSDGIRAADTAVMLSPYLRKADTTNKWWSKTKRFVDTMYSVNDSTIGYTILGDAYTFQIKGGATPSGLNIYNGDGTLSGDRILTQSGNYLRFQQGITYVQFNGAKETYQPDSVSTYILQEIKSPYSGTPAQGMLTWYRSLGQALQVPSRPNYPLIEGWNLDAGGGAAVAGLPALGHSFEPHYLPDPLTPSTWKMEYHIIYVTPQGLQRRPFSIEVNTNTNLMQGYFTLQNIDFRDTVATYFTAGIDRANSTASIALLSTTGSAAGLTFTADNINNTVAFQPAISTSDLVMNQWDNVTLPGNYFDENGFITVQHLGPFNIQRTSAQSVLNFLDGASVRAYINLDVSNGTMNFQSQAGYVMNFLPSNTQAAKFLTTGSLMLNTVGTTTDETSRKLYINGSVGANKDSVTLQAFRNARQMVVFDTATGKFERMDLGDSVTITRSPLITYTGAGLIPDTIAIAGLSGFGSVGQSIRVNATGDGFEYFTPGTGGGDVISNETSNTDGQLPLFGTETDGKHLKKFTGSGVLIGTSGVVTAGSTSADIAAAISDETGTGVLTFATAPTFTTNITTPLTIGGTGTGSTLTLKSTTGVGATDAIIFQVGNNGATTGLTINNGGQLITTNGTSSLPAVAFTSNTNTGIYRAASNTLGLAAAGNAFTFSAQTFQFGSWGNGVDNQILGTNAGAGTSNRAANHMQISAGVGTGNGAASEIRLSVGTTGPSGTSLNALSQIVRIATTGIFLNQTPNGAGADSILTINATSVRKIAASTFVTSNIYTADGTLAGNRQLSGGTNSLQLGTSGSKLSGLTVNASGNISLITDGRIFLLGNITYQAVNHTTDADLTVPDNTAILELSSGSLTADRTITLPTASTHGQVITIAVRVTGSSNHYVLSAAVPDIKTGTTFTQLEYGTTYDFMVNSSVAWMLIRKY